MRRRGLCEMNDVLSLVELQSACWRGRVEEALDLAERAKVACENRGEDADLYLVWLTVLELGRGRYREAYNHALPVLQNDKLPYGDTRYTRLHRVCVPLW